MKDEKKNYYEALDLPTDATQDEIKQAYHSSLIAYAEDSVAIYSLLSSDDCKSIRELIEEAYSILGDPSKRLEYDKHRGLNQSVHQTSFLDQQAAPSAPSNTSMLNGSAARQKLPSFNFNEEGQQQESVHAPAAHHHTVQYKKEAKNSEVDVEEARRRFALHYRENMEMEEKIKALQDFNGKILREIREYKNVSIEKMAEMTRILKAYINHIENEEYEKLPATAYVRGFIFQYAKQLKLNPDVVSSSYISKLKQRRGEELLQRTP